MKNIMRTISLIWLSLFFIQCSNTSEKPTPNYSSEELKSYRETGLESAMSTKSALAAVLIPTVSTQGTVEALQYCNTQAIPLTDSVSTYTSHSIKRVSDKARNPANEANETELTYILDTKERIAAGEEPTPKVFAVSDKVIGYYPIMTNQFCLQCHGSIGKQISEETYATIQELYPNDKAIDYSEGELRGIFVVEMEGKSTN